jgi:hypothetical protein
MDGSQERALHARYSDVEKSGEFCRERVELTGNRIAIEEGHRADRDPGDSDESRCISITETCGLVCRFSMAREGPDQSRLGRGGRGPMMAQFRVA